MTLRSLELFAGAGGLALGLRMAGFRHIALVESDVTACKTLNANASRLGFERTVEPTDAKAFVAALTGTPVDLLAAGVPCQPFSRAGKRLGFADARNLFPIVLAAICRLEPKAVLIENVSGLTHVNFQPRFQYILRQLGDPDCTRRANERWFDHDKRLRARRGPKAYDVFYATPQAADYGVPQLRHRLVIVAYRSDLGTTWSELAPNYSRERLLFDQWVTGDYWRDHGLRPPAVPAGLRSTVRRLETEGQPKARRWRTVRDALTGLDEPSVSRVHGEHVARPGARAYAGHRGSHEDWPARTLKAGVHGVPGGENMLRRATNGSVRYFTVREAARLQSFPDRYMISGVWSQAFRQLGNAVPVRLARVLGGAIYADIARPRARRAA
jgi:DNA (cytosine-5)-methyltransferase 1